MNNQYIIYKKEDLGYAFFQLRLLRLRLMKRKATRKKIVNMFIYKGLSPL